MERHIVSYERSASVYDTIYEAKKNYRAEAERVRALIEQYGRSGGNTLLDMACGTGLHDQYLRQWFDIEGADLSEAQLAIARERLPDITLYEADMTGFNTGKHYDAVTCLFSAVGHLQTLEDLNRAIEEMARHLYPGGVLIVEPWLSPGMFVPGKVGLDFVDNPPNDIVARITETTLSGHITELRMHHFVKREKEVDYFVEVHCLAMYTIEEYMDAFRAAGLQVWHDEEGLMGRGIFIGRKRS